jgi:hypothetical protein
MEDMLNVVTYLEQRTDINPRRIGAYGLRGTGGGNAVMVAGLDARIRCVCAQTAIADGAAWLHRLRREHEWIELLKRLREDDRRWVLEGEGDRVPAGSLAVPDRAQASAGVRPIEGVSDLYLRSARYVMQYRPIDVVANIAPRAPLLTSLEDDPITPEDFILALWERAGSPKRLIRQYGVDHHHAYARNFARLSAEFIDWYNRYLTADPQTGADLSIAEVGWVSPEEASERP